MPRVLPWKRRSASSTTPIKTDPDQEDKTSLAHSATTSSKKRDGHSEGYRPGSTSPPPEPLQESYMVEGFDADDGYHMVEDEFLITAQQFTAHLHAAEYHRQKEAAKTQNAALISKISRPVVGVTSHTADRKHERAELRKKQKAAMRSAGMEVSDDSDDDDSDLDLDSALKGTPLYALMISPRKRAPRLDLIAAAKGPRAAAGFGPSSSQVAEPSRHQSTSASSPIRKSASTAMNVNDTDDDSDDLDVPSGPPTRINLPAPKPAYSGGSRNSDNRPQTHNPTSITGVKRPATVTKTTSSSTPGSQATPPITAQPSETSDDDSDDNDFFGIKNRMARHNTRDRKRVKTDTQQLETSNAKSTSKPSSSSSRRDFIPGFL
ncbi:hypothetical protein PGQ11_006208 [Apiospora arundinis]|uniref:Uncharacterized protein n=1 Tax=Apiospora arundinis TaxID=335852 RepID=A0ABR2ISL9_9PEZI